MVRVHLISVDDQSLDVRSQRRGAQHVVQRALLRAFLLDLHPCGTACANAAHRINE